MAIEDRSMLGKARTRGLGTRSSSTHPQYSESRLAAAELDSLIGPAANGDRAATSRILEIVYPLVRRYCLARIGNGSHLPVSADDVVQEVCIATVAAIPRYQDQGKSFLAFVYGISANKVADAFRRATTHPVYPVAEFPEQAGTGAGPEEIALLSESGRTAGELMKLLSPNHREVLVMRIVLGWSAAETAAALGTSPGVVRVMQHRALTRLRAELAA
nr:sigma-70 family RNA polymerase sigma factor [Nocardia stercoris]